MKALLPTSSNIAAAIILCAVLFLAGRRAAPQTAPVTPGLQLVLQRLGAVAESLDHSLPSLTCIETAVSESLKNGKVRKHVEFTSNLRAVRSPTGHLHETFTVIQVDGKPYKRARYSIPYYASDGLDSALIYFLPHQQPCFVYTLSPGRIDFATIPEADSHPPCHTDGLRGFALLDAEGNVTHVERTVSQEAVHKFRLVPFAAIDLSPLKLNGEVFQLSHRFISETPEGSGAGRFDATYSNCRLFTATVTILPGAQIVPDTTPPSQ